MIYNVIIAVVSLALGFLGAYLLLGVFNKRAKREMEAEAELLKEKRNRSQGAIYSPEGRARTTGSTAKC